MIHFTKNLILISSILLFGCSSDKDRLSTVIKKTKDAVGLITVYNGVDSVISRGTGFLIGKNQLVTNKHVLRVAHRADVKFHSGKVYPITFITAESDSIDLVIAEIENQRDELPYLTPSKKLIKEGDRIVVVGSPLGLEGTVSEGIVSSIRSVSTYGSIIQMTAPISPGSSGSPVMDFDASVVGIATMYLQGGQNLNFAIPISSTLSLKSVGRMLLSDWTLPATAEELSKYFDLLDKGTKFFEAEDYSIALSFFLKAAESYLANAGPFIYIPQCYEKLGRYIDAFDAYELALKRWPELDINHYRLGQLYLRFGRERDAIRIYRILKEEHAGFLYSVKTGENYYAGLLYNKIRTWQRANNRPLLR
jgi:V8-like Glu-specific endopeptidase